MAQHFLTSAKARTLSLTEVARFTEEEAENFFALLRWEETDGKAVCPHCGCGICYASRRKNGHLRYRCKACRKDFSVTSGTLFAFHKLPIRDYLTAIALVCNEVKGKAALALSRDLGVQHKTAWVLAHKIREAMLWEQRPKALGGDGKVVEIDGAFFGGFIKKANRKEYRRDLRKPKNKNGKERAVVVARERGGQLWASSFRDEICGALYMADFIAPGSTIMADESKNWNHLEGHYKVLRINHKRCYAEGEVSTNLAESFFSRLRRMELGIHHHIAGPYLHRYAMEQAWRERHRREDNGAQILDVVRLALRGKTSDKFSRYWQRKNVEPRMYYVFGDDMFF